MRQTSLQFASRFPVGRMTLLRFYGTRESHFVLRDGGAAFSLRSGRPTAHEMPEPATGDERNADNKNGLISAVN